MKELMGYLDRFPKKWQFLLKGPWSPIAYLVLGVVVFYLSYTSPSAMQAFLNYANKDVSHGIPLQIFRLSIGLYALAVTIILTKNMGFIPLTTYTITSWNLLTIRCLTAFLGQYHYIFESIAEITRFPALAGCTITVTIWWLLIAPIIHHFLAPEKKAAFRKFNTSFVLINIHLANLFMAGIEFIWSNKPLYFYDLWCSICIALIYVLFYLFYLDPAGLHFYIILSPRTVLCIMSYMMILLLYYGLYYGWNNMLIYVYST